MAGVSGRIKKRCEIILVAERRGCRNLHRGLLSGCSRPSVRLPLWEHQWLCHLLSVLEVCSSLCELPTDICGVTGCHSAAEQTTASRGARITLCSSHGRPAHFSVNRGPVTR